MKSDRYNEFIRVIADHPGCTRYDLRHIAPHITHECEYLKRGIEEGKLVRERVDGKTAMGAWGYWTVTA